MTPVPLVGEERIVLEEVSWEAYEALMKSWADRPIRVTYDNGRLEIMSPLLRHESYSVRIGRFIETFTMEMDIPIRSGQSTTFRRKAKKRGLEPDKCYWIQNEQAMRGKEEFDVRHDPPPDLAIEVDITSSSLDRMSIYATLGIHEIWRFDGETFSIHLLRDGDRYETSDTSAALPDLPPAVVMRFLELGEKQDETSLIRAFLAWVRDEVLAARTPPPAKSRRPRKK